jgi:hypothetical protein
LDNDDQILRKNQPESDIDTIESVGDMIGRYVATSTPTRVSPTTPKSIINDHSGSKKLIHSSNLSLVDKEFHDKGIEAVREMYDSTSASYSSKKDKDHHHFDFINPLKLSQKLIREKSEANDKIYHRENKFDDNRSSIYESYSKASNKKISNEPKSPVLSRPISSSSFIRDDHVELNNSYTSRGLNESLMSKFIELSAYHV